MCYKDIDKECLGYYYHWQHLTEHSIEKYEDVFQSFDIMYTNTPGDFKCQREIKQDTISDCIKMWMNIKSCLFL